MIAPSRLLRGLQHATAALAVLLPHATAQVPDLLVRTDAGTARLDLETGTLRAASDDTPPHLRLGSFEDQGMTCRVADWPAIPSPDGRAIAFLVHVDQRPVRQRPAQPRLALLGDDGVPRLVPSRTECHTPAWLPDGRHLWFVQEAEDGRSPPSIACYDLGNGSVELVDEPSVRLQPTPRLLADGHWLLLRASDDPRAEPGFDLVVQDRLGQGTVRQVVQRDATFVRSLGATGNGLVVWFTHDQELLRYDRVQRRVTHRWQRPELAPGEDLRFGQMLVRPEADAVVLTLWRDRPGVDIRFPVLLQIGVPTAGLPQIRRFDLEQGVLLHGFVARASAAAALPSTSPEQR